jgi:hypothetical protein
MEGRGYPLAYGGKQWELWHAFHAEQARLSATAAMSFPLSTSTNCIKAILVW